jgi:competence protein ComEC
MVAFLLKGKEIFLHTIQAHLSQPHAHFLGALLLGDRSGFPAWLTDAFVRSGIVHIVAISGYNITIMIVSIYALLRACAFGRKQSFWCIVFGVICFVILTGSSASVVRAALMGICALIAQYVGRKNDTGNAIFCAAALMVAWNPAVLFDIGFQLSFAATLGLVYIAPIFENLFEKISNAYGIKTLMLQTISAMLATTPLLVYFFGRFSVIALVVNMLVLPLIPFVMAFGFFWAILAVCGEMLGSLVTLPLDMLIQIASWPVWFLLSYIMIISQWFAHIPWASTDVSLGAWSWVAVYAAYASMVWCVWAYRSMKRLKKERAMI